MALKSASSLFLNDSKIIFDNQISFSCIESSSHFEEIFSISLYELMFTKSLENSSQLFLKSSDLSAVKLTRSSPFSNSKSFSSISIFFSEKNSFNFDRSGNLICK